MQCLTVPSGVGAGGPFLLREWQKDFIREVYGPVIGGRRVVRRAVLSMARKNGKTALIAALALAHLVGPEAELNGEIYSAANEREQAAIVFKVAAQIVRADPELSALLRVVDSTKTIACYGNGSVYRAISAEAGSKHGLNPTVVIYDELAQARNRELYDVLDTSMGAREEPLFITISTQSNDPEHILSQLIDDGLRGDDPTSVTRLYAVPDDVEDIYSEGAWRLANPALDDFRDLDDMRVMAERAKRMPSFESAFRNLYLNQRVDSRAAFIPAADWKACASDGDLLRHGEAIYLGLDLSTTTDLSAMVAVSADDGDRVAAWFWKPGDLLRQHSDRDGVDYVEWARRGLIDAPPGRAVRYSYIAEKIGEIAAIYEVRGLAYDRYRMEVLAQQLDEAGVRYWIEGKTGQDAGALRMVPFGQGYVSMGPAVEALESSVIQGDLRHPNNPVLNWNMMNALPDVNPAGDRKLTKAKSRFRIDGAVALVMAKGLKAKDLTTERVISSPWDDPDFRMAM